MLFGFGKSIAASRQTLQIGEELIQEAFVPEADFYNLKIESHRPIELDEALSAAAGCPLAKVDPCSRVSRSLGRPFSPLLYSNTSSG